MEQKLSPGLAAIVRALPLEPGMRVLEIGCGPGAMARAMTAQVGDGHVLAIDRSAKAIAQAETGSRALIEAGQLGFRQVAAEELELRDDDALFDIAIAVRLGALDGRHPKAGEIAKSKIAKALTPEGRLFIDGGSPLREIDLTAYRGRT